MVPQGAQESVPSAFDCFVFGFDANAVHALALLDGPASHGAISGMPLQHTEQFTRWDAARVFFAWRLHAFSGTGSNTQLAKP